MKTRIIVGLVALGLGIGLFAYRDKGSQVPSAHGSNQAVLSPEVGKSLEGIVRSDRVKAAVPQGWTIESVQVQARSIVVKLTGPGGAGASVQLKAPDAGGAEKGRWFSFDVPDTPKGLKALAEALDAGFASSPWSEPKREGVPPHPGEAPAALAPGAPVEGGQPPPPAPPVPTGGPGSPGPSPSAAPGQEPGAPPSGSGGPTPAAPPSEAPTAPSPASPQSRARPSPTPAWTVVASASGQVLGLLGVVAWVLRDEWRS